MLGRHLFTGRCLSPHSWQSGWRNALSIHKRLAPAICNKHITLLLIAPFDSPTKTQSGTLCSEDALFCKGKCWRHAESKIACLCCFNILGSQQTKGLACSPGVHTKHPMWTQNLMRLGLAALVQELLRLLASHAKLTKKACRMPDRDGGGNLEAGMLDWAETGLGCWDSMAVFQAGLALVLFLLSTSIWCHVCRGMPKSMMDPWSALERCTKTTVFCRDVVIIEPKWLYLQQFWSTEVKTEVT